MNDLIDAYMEAAEFTNRDIEGIPWSAELLEQTAKDCRQFVRDWGHLFDDRMADAGHAFWLTRNTHGAGFWDGDWEEDYQGTTIGDILTSACEYYGEVCLYEGDDGLIYG